MTQSDDRQRKKTVLGLHIFSNDMYGGDVDEMIDFQRMIAMQLSIWNVLELVMLWFQNICIGAMFTKMAILNMESSHAWLLKICVNAISTKMRIVTNETIHASLQHFAWG